MNKSWHEAFIWFLFHLTKKACLGPCVKCDHCLGAFLGYPICLNVARTKGASLPIRNSLLGTPTSPALLHENFCQPPLPLGLSCGHTWCISLSIAQDSISNVCQGVQSMSIVSCSKSSWQNDKENFSFCQCDAGLCGGTNWVEVVYLQWKFNLLRYVNSPTGGKTYLLYSTTTAKKLQLKDQRSSQLEVSCFSTLNPITIGQY